MKSEIKLSKRTLRKLDSLLIYLEEEWSANAKHEFVMKLDKSLKQIQKLPDSFPESEKISFTTRYSCSMSELSTAILFSGVGVEIAEN